MKTFRCYTWQINPIFFLFLNIQYIHLHSFHWCLWRPARCLNWSVFLCHSPQAIKQYWSYTVKHSLSSILKELLYNYRSFILLAVDGSCLAYMKLNLWWHPFQKSTCTNISCFRFTSHTDKLRFAPRINLWYNFSAITGGIFSFCDMVLTFATRQQWSQLRLITCQNCVVKMYD